MAAGVSGGALPGLGPLVWGALTWRVGVRGRFELSGGAQIPTETPSDVDPNVGGRLGLWAIGPRLCGVPRIAKGRVEFPLCGGFEVGQVFGEGYGFEGANRVRVPWGALVVTAGIAFVPRPRIAIVLIAEAGIAIHRVDLVIERLATLHRIGFGTGRGLLAVEFRLPARARAMEPTGISVRARGRSSSG